MGFSLPGWSFFPVGLESARAHAQVSGLFGLLSLNKLMAIQIQRIGVYHLSKPFVWHKKPRPYELPQLWHCFSRPRASAPSYSLLHFRYMRKLWKSLRKRHVIAFGFYNQGRLPTPVSTMLWWNRIIDGYQAVPDDESKPEFGQPPPPRLHIQLLMEILTLYKPQTRASSTT